MQDNSPDNPQLSDNGHPHAQKQCKDTSPIPTVSDDFCGSFGQACAAHEGAHPECEPTLEELEEERLNMVGVILGLLLVANLLAVVVLCVILWVRP